jgi:hypothetical protein
MEDAAADVTRQAELVVMDCLKSWNCPRALAAFMEKASVSGVSAIASERFSDDMEAKKKATQERTSLLEYMISAASDSKDPPSSSNRRRAGSSETDSAIEWAKDEISALKKAIKKTSAVEDKNARWKQIAGLVGNGKTKKHCYLKYKELKQEQASAAAKKASPRRKRTGDDTTKPDSDEAEANAAKSDAKSEVDDGEDLPPSEVDPPASKELQEPSTAFVASQRAVAPVVTTLPTSFEALEVEDCEDLGVFLEQPTAGTTCRAPTSRSSNSSSSVSSGTTRVPTSSDVAVVQQLLFGATKKTFSSHWEEQVSYGCVVSCWQHCEAEICVLSQWYYAGLCVLDDAESPVRAGSAPRRPVRRLGGRPGLRAALPAPTRSCRLEKRTYTFSRRSHR